MIKKQKWTILIGLILLACLIVAYFLFLAPMLSKELSPIDWTRTARQIHDQVRGLIPWPCATTEVGGKRVKVFATAFGAETNAAAGTVVAAGKQGIEIACGDGKTLLITQLQAEGGKRMAAADYLRGHSVQVGV